MFRGRARPLSAAKGRGKISFGLILWPLLAFTIILYGIIAWVVLRDTTDAQLGATVFDDDLFEHQRHHSLDSLGDTQSPIRISFSASPPPNALALMHTLVISDGGFASQEKESW
jgi:hypothetical protein